MMNSYKKGNCFIQTIGTINEAEIITNEEFNKAFAEAEAEPTAEAAEQEYWANISYDEAVNAEIRKRYSESAEFAILRQKDDKPEEYAEYYAYCEECKALVKSKKGVK